MFKFRTNVYPERTQKQELRELFLKKENTRMLDNKADRAKRLEKFLNHLEIKQVAFSKRVGIGRTYVSHLLTGYRKITDGMAMKIAEAYPSLNREWLLWGEGEMLTDKNLPAAVQEVGTGNRPAKKGDALDALKTLLEGYEREIKDLRSRVERLETRVDYLSKEET